MSEFAIVMPSFGKRPWAQTSFKSFQDYANRHQMDAHLVTEDRFEDLRIDEVDDTRGRKNKRAYALKSYLAWHFLTPSEGGPGYSKVLVVDDTCLVHPQAPSIFESHANATLTMTTTSKHHARRSHKHILRLAQKGYLPSVPLDPEPYGNTGVVLYDWSIRDVFSPSSLMRCQRLLEAAFPHQTTLYWLLQHHGIQLTTLEKSWNRTPAAQLSSEAKRALRSIRQSNVDLDRSRIMHVTSAFPHREELIRSIAKEYQRI